MIDSRFSYVGENVVAALDRDFREIAYSKLISVENESEFFSRNFCPSGRPDENSFIGALNSKLRSECLNLPDACEKLEAWRAYCQEERLHRYLGISPDHAGKLSRLKQPSGAGTAENSGPEWSDVWQHFKQPPCSYLSLN